MRSLRSLSILSFILVLFSPPITALDKPETVLLNLLTKPFAPSEGASEQCLKDSANYLTEITRYAAWALQMYDASVKIPSGIITGNYKLLGNYDECLRARSEHGFTGKACTATVQFDIEKDNGTPREYDLGDLLLDVAVASGTKWSFGKTVAYEWMWCVPSSCNHTEIQKALEIALDPLKIKGRVDMTVNVDENSCHTAETDRPVLDVTDWIYISILVTFAVTIIASTSYDIVNQGRPSALNRKDTRDVLLTSFSIYTNGRNLLKTDRHRDSIRCLDGLRYLSICWIICGHTLYCEVVSVKMNLNEVPSMHLNWANMLLLNGNIVTDTFLLLSGVLMAYTAIAKHRKNPNGRLNVIGLYLHRYIRLTPAYAMMIGFYATLFYKLGTGPRWDQWVGENRNFCRENWWTNLLYVNNFVNLPRICMSQSWYLATDMQLAWLSPIFLYPMLKFTRDIFFWLIIVTSLVVSVLVPFLITFIQRLPATMLYYKDPLSVADVYVQIYTKVYTRYGSYVIGLVLGYILHKTRSRAVEIRSVYVIVGWSIAALSGLFVFLSPRWMYFDEHPYDKVEASFYAGFHRQIFVLSISWIIFCCVHGYAGFLGDVLGWKGWVPLGKLTYSAYLCHYVFMLSEAGTARTPGVISLMSILRSFCSNLCLAMLLAVIWSLCFEMPFMTLDRALLSHGKNRSTKSSQTKTYSFAEPSKQSYRSTNQLSSTFSQSSDNGSAERKPGKECLHISEGNVGVVDGRAFLDQREERSFKRRLRRRLGQFVAIENGHATGSRSWIRVDADADFQAKFDSKPTIRRDESNKPRGRLVKCYYIYLFIEVKRACRSSVCLPYTRIEKK
ncbi:nose resistant to fluoxetine protein 6-like isoform X2 [Hylaeus anthracinus]|uniref:nose resistant to fluoxetine protein 6-like isoform X2 n=1 Tax=Hylaeus anthracinus TaxID=313031 RepID=UPI0023B8F24D|nr:nose resistant to fluoxetine protein 6-like isoform X2 [Hylaeus anthracinus]